jgi:hypothetical protein
MEDFKEESPMQFPEGEASVDLAATGSKVLPEGDEDSP